MIRFLISLVFVLFALVQYNDPDPARWMLVYLAVAFHAFFSKKEWYKNIYRTILLLSIFIAFSLYLPDVVHWFKEGMPNITTAMKADSPYVELVREGLGLLLCLVAVYFFKTQTKKSNSN